MNKFGHILVAIAISTAPFCGGTTGQWWAVGPLDGIEYLLSPPVVSTTTILPVVRISTFPTVDVILKSPTTPDCYKLTVTPNGTLGAKYVTCPK